MNFYKSALFIAITATFGCASSASPNEILYRIGPVEDGAFVAIDIALDVESLTYTTPHNDGYGVFRFAGNDICFLASYSDTERCINYLVPYTEWKVGDVWEIKSFDGSAAVVTVKAIE